MGKSSTYIVDSLIAILCFSCSVIYSGILGDLLTSLLSKSGLANTGRTTNIIAVTLICLLPMSLIKNLSALAFTSILGFSAIFYTVIFIVYRALDGSYKLPLGKFVSGDKSLELLPSFAKSSLWRMDFSSLVLASNLGAAYIAHYNGPNFYRNLADTNSKRFGKMVNISFFILIVLYGVTMAAGYSTFGDVCQGNILLNYHPDDILSTLGSVATLASILFGFPLVVTGAREGLIGAATSLGWKSVGDARNHFWVVASILAAVTAIACTIQDVSLVVGLTGASMGSFIVYICPALIYTRAVRQCYGQGSSQEVAARRYLALVPFGILIGAFGMFMTLKNQ
jgi:amino acid permease